MIPKTYPATYELFDEYVTAYQQLKNDLHRVLVYDMPLRNKYTKILQNDDRGRHIFIYVQRGTDKIIQITVDPVLGASRRGKDPVDIFAEDVSIKNVLENLDSIATIREKLGECLELVYEDQVIAKLKYKNISPF